MCHGLHQPQGGEAGSDARVARDGGEQAECQTGFGRTCGQGIGHAGPEFGEGYAPLDLHDRHD